MQAPNQSTSAVMTISSNVTVSRRSNIVSCNLSDETVLLDLTSGIYFGLNQVGASIWALIATPRSTGELRDELLKEYEIDTAACDTAMLQFLNHLAAKGLITLQEK
ncbi:MAG: hypothetical protein JWO19_1219 [Bryobacterales bacterium]|jgi:hypothetical protein|nr:hypothetical protein [Bryobacterales bacterium]